jgi:hypothetical protein
MVVMASRGENFSCRSIGKESGSGDIQGRKEFLMNWKKTEAELRAKARKHASALIGRKVVKVKMPVDVPGHFSSLTLVFDDGTEFFVAPGGEGCWKCDPDGIGWGLSVDRRQKP